MNGELDCSEENIKGFHVTDLIQRVGEMPIEAARRRIGGLEPEDEIVYAAPTGTSPTARRDRGGREITQIAFISTTIGWTASEGWMCDGFGIRVLSAKQAADVERSEASSV